MIDRDRLGQIAFKGYASAFWGSFTGWENVRDSYKQKYIALGEAIAAEVAKDYELQIQLLRDALEAVTDCLERVGDSRKDGHIVRWGKDALAQTQPQESTDEN